MPAGANDPEAPAAEATLLALANARGPSRSICPSEVARELAGDGDWRGLMPLVHRTAENLAASGAVVLMQRGRPVGAGRPRGAYRIRTGR